MKQIVLWFGFLGLMATAQAGQGFFDKLKAVNSKVALEFSPIMTQVEKAASLDLIYDRVMTGTHSEVYGKNALVHKLYVESSQFWPAEKQASAARLRGHALIVSQDAKTLDIFEASIAREKEVLNQVLSLERSLAGVAKPKVKINRQGDFSQVELVSSNESYLELLKQVDRLIADGFFEDFATLNVKDSASVYTTLEVGAYPNYFNPKNKDFYLSVGRADRFADDLEFSYEALKGFVAPLSLYGLTSFNTTLVPHETLNAVGLELASWLSAEKAAFLLSKGVKSLQFDPRFKYEQDLLQGSSLIVGLTAEEMQFVVDLLF